MHAALEHAYAVCELRSGAGSTRVVWHAFLDGRDTPPRSAAGYLRDVDAQLKKIGVGKLASAVGRYYAMDRDKRWERLEIAWKMLTRGEGKVVDDLAAAVEAAYSGANNADGKDLTDEFVKPLLHARPRRQAAGDDRGRRRLLFFELPRRPRAPADAGAARARVPAFRSHAAPQAGGVRDHDPVRRQARRAGGVPAQSLDMILGEVLSKAGVSQLRTAETEKYAHVTYFFNGGVEAAFPGEERKLVPSNRQVATYDLAPEMSAPPVTDGVVSALQSTDAGGPQFILVNYANPDMVGHTGMLEAGDHRRSRPSTPVSAASPTRPRRRARRVFITADHGNCETMIDPETGQPHTAHTTNPVPFIVLGPGLAGRKLRSGGRLCDVAPTILEYLGIQQPAADGRGQHIRGASAVSIGRRLIDLARAELNSLLDRAARAEEDDDYGSADRSPLRQGARGRAGAAARRRGRRQSTPRAARGPTAKASRSAMRPGAGGAPRGTHASQRSSRGAGPSFAAPAPTMAAPCAAPTRRWRCRRAPTSRPCAARTAR